MYKERTKDKATEGLRHTDVTIVDNKTPGMAIEELDIEHQGWLLRNLT